MFQDPAVQVAQEVPVVRTVLQQKSQVHQEGPGALEDQEGRADPQPSVPENQVGPENQVVREDPEDPVVRVVQEVPGDQEVQMVLKQRQQDQVYRRRNRQQENREPQGVQEDPTVPVDPAVREDQVRRVSSSNEFFTHVSSCYQNYSFSDFREKEIL